MSAEMTASSSAAHWALLEAAGLDASSAAEKVQMKAVLKVAA